MFTKILYERSDLSLDLFSNGDMLVLLFIFWSNLEIVYFLFCLFSSLEKTNTFFGVPTELHSRSRFSPNTHLHVQKFYQNCIQKGFENSLSFPKMLKILANLGSGFFTLILHHIFYAILFTPIVFHHIFPSIL